MKHHTTDYKWPCNVSKSNTQTLQLNQYFRCYCCCFSSFSYVPFLFFFSLFLFFCFGLLCPKPSISCCLFLYTLSSECGRWEPTRNHHNTPYHFADTVCCHIFPIYNKAEINGRAYQSFDGVIFMDTVSWWDIPFLSPTKSGRVL